MSWPTTRIARAPPSASATGPAQRPWGVAALHHQTTARHPRDAAPTVHAPWITTHARSSAGRTAKRRRVAEMTAVVRPSSGGASSARTRTAQAHACARTKRDVWPTPGTAPSLEPTAAAVRRFVPAMAYAASRMGSALPPRTPIVPGPRHACAVDDVRRGDRLVRPPATVTARPASIVSPRARARPLMAAASWPRRRTVSARPRAPWTAAVGWDQTASVWRRSPLSTACSCT